jgi:hypothetical protein
MSKNNSASAQYPILLWDAQDRFRRHQHHRPIRVDIKRARGTFQYVLFERKQFSPMLFHFLRRLSTGRFWLVTVRILLAENGAAVIRILNR